MKVDLKEGGSTFFELRRSVQKTERLCLAQMLVYSPRIQLQAEGRWGWNPTRRCPIQRLQYSPLSNL